jgi:ribosomal protein L23
VLEEVTLTEDIAIAVDPQATKSQTRRHVSRLFDINSKTRIMSSNFYQLRTYGDHVNVTPLAAFHRQQ